MASISASTHEAEVPDPPGEDYTSDYTSDSTSDSTSDPPSPLTNREAKCIERFLNNYERIFGAPATGMSSYNIAPKSFAPITKSPLGLYSLYNSTPH